MTASGMPWRREETMILGPIEDRLRASVRYNAINGDAGERRVCRNQMEEAAREIDRLPGR